jgi:hypothetical protein
MDVVPDRGVFSREPECIESHRKHDVVTAHPLEPGKHIRHGERVPVAYMEDP